MNTETGGGLTAEERERLLIASHTVERQHEIGEALFAAVERILADRDAALARVEALWRQWDDTGGDDIAPGYRRGQYRSRARELRAALDPAPSEGGGE